MSPLESAIHDLGDTAESIATKLREKKIKGRLRRACDCPIANYLKVCGFSSVSVSVKAIFTQGLHYSEEHWGGPETANVPNQVGRWILDFDDGKYPEFQG
jgi:hypothetical protein